MRRAQPAPVALKMESRARSLGIQRLLKDEKGKEIDFFPKVPRRNTALLTLDFSPVGPLTNLRPTEL